MRYWILAIFLLAVVGVGGCGPELSKQDLGTVVFDDPKVPGSEKPYVLPGAKAKPTADGPSAVGK